MKAAVLLASSCFILFTGCATTTLAPKRVASVQETMRAASEVGAAKQPRAALHLRLAREELEKARELAAEGEQERAELFLDRAALDATLALALARADEARGEADKARTALLDFEGVTP